MTERQARHFVQLVRLMEREAQRHFRVPAASGLPKDRCGEFFKLETYPTFIEGAYACGFVCRDSNPDNPLESERERERVATAVIDRWCFPEIRRYVYYLLRHERSADGYSSPIMDSLVEGQLHRMGSARDGRYAVTVLEVAAVRDEVALSGSTIASSTCFSSSAHPVAVDSV